MLTHLTHERPKVISLSTRKVPVRVAEEYLESVTAKTGGNTERRNVCSCLPVIHTRKRVHCSIMTLLLNWSFCTRSSGACVEFPRGSPTDIFDHRNSISSNSVTGAGPRCRCTSHTFVSDRRVWAVRGSLLGLFASAARWACRRWSASTRSWFGLIVLRSPTFARGACDGGWT